MTDLPLAVDLRTERRPDPIGLDELRPRLSWQVRLDSAAIRQGSFAVQVASDPRFSARALRWSPPPITGAEPWIVYDGPPPRSRERCFWRVRLVDDRGVEGPWSAPASFEMGLLAPSDWHARWIGWIDPTRPSWSSRSPLLRRSFRLAGTPDRVRLYRTALGLVEVLINGRPVGTDRLAPGWTDYRSRIQVAAFDVADLLRPGENVVAARLGRGWYAGDVGQFGAEQYGDFPALLAQLEIEPARGRRMTVATDSSWRAHPGPLVEDDLLMGERIDARDEPPGWTEPGFRDDDWLPVVQVAGPGGRLVAQRDPGAVVVAELAPRAISRLDADRQIVDFGQNLAGHVRIRAAAPAGTTIVIRHAEALTREGELYTANLRKARQTDAYTFRGEGEGEGEETFEPRFTTHGFRYAEVSGWPGDLDPAGITARAVSSLGPEAGTFACSDELVNAIHRNVVWGLRGGTVGIPTDCPQRDERLGWTADAAAMAPSALFVGDPAVFEAWLVDLADAQLPSGAYPDVAPTIGVTGGGNAGWADAGIELPWLLYQRTGDPGVIERQYDSMQRYVRFLAADHVDGVRHGGRYGDWLALEPTSLELIGTAYLAHSAALFARMAGLLGRAADAEATARLARRATRAFRRRFLSAPGTLREESQTGYALALGCGLLRGAERPMAAGRLAALVEAAGAHLRTGFLGTAPVLPALSDHGFHELAARVVRAETYPGWGFQVRQGATTIWERWNSWTPDDGFADPGMNSLNHAALGSVADWLHEHLAGLAPGEPGYARALIRIRPVPGIDWAWASHESPHGRHAVDWRADARRVEVTVEVPPNTLADVVLPGRSGTIRVGGRRALPGARGVVRLGSSSGNRVVTLGWGRHVLELER